MNKIVKIAIVMAMMMSANFAFGQETGNDSNNQAGIVMVNIDVVAPSINVNKIVLTYRWGGDNYWAEWQTESVQGMSATFNLWSYTAYTKLQYQLIAWENGAPIDTHAGQWTKGDNTTVNITTWNHYRLYTGY